MGKIVRRGNSKVPATESGAVARFTSRHARDATEFNEELSMKYKGLALSAALIVSVGAVSAVALAGYQGKGHHGGWHDGGHHGHGKHHGRGHHGKMGMMHKFQRLKSLDTNKDGAVTLEEAIKPKLDKFAKADTNGDGFLDGNELTAGKAGKLGHRSRIMMAKLDADGDGKVTKDEFASAHHGKRGHRGMRRGRHGGGDHVMHG
ncbi:MAG: EF-hand domain-containing protein, partial [Hyphomicrobiaceae bacterium]